MPKKIAIAIASKDFKDEEYFISKQILEEAGFEIITASASLGIALGVSGGEAEIEFLVKDLNIEDFEAVLFIGGPGCLKYLDNPASYNIIKKAVYSGKVLGAICIAPVILAKAGVLKGKKATVWHSSLDKSAIKTLKGYGVVFEESNAVIDGNIITSPGPFAVEEFAEAIISLLKR